MRKKRKRHQRQPGLIHVTHVPAQPPDELYCDGEHFYLTSKAIEILGLPDNDAALGGEELVHLMASYKIEMHILPLKPEMYSYYVKKSDVEMARELLAAGIPYKRETPPEELPCVVHTSRGWEGSDIDTRGWKIMVEE